MPEVREERTGWRDLEFSHRHRKWGWDLPMVDIDFLVAEYDKSLPIAIIEYKHEKASIQKTDSSSYKALSFLADNSLIPFFLCRYKSDFSLFRLTSISKFAQDRYKGFRDFTEEEYVRYLYELRGKQLPHLDLFHKL